ncbi:MAG TPA: alpha/beta fold hydrolase [Ktedonobacterales bacterium]|nr:alpha/beta fold hydrolase [Ktedonobacterales bacterium]
MTTIDARAIAIKAVEMARGERFVELAALFAPPLRAAVSAENMRVFWLDEIGKHGPVTAIGEPVIEPVREGLIRVSVPVTCDHGGLTVIMSIDNMGLLNGLRLALAGAATASWTPPPYANTRRFTEHEVTVGSGPLAVPGTLSLPDGRGPRPGVVLLSGGGPFDRDETDGPNRPLKDLAWGLASRGVAVVRFDKVTYAHSRQVANIDDFTMTEEYVPHAVAAIHMLQRQPSVDPTRIFVLGHSMGGKVVPRVANAEASVAGLIMLAGDAQPMQHAAIRVARYLASLNPGTAAEEAVEVITRQAAMVDSPNLSSSTPASELPFGYSGSYWLDMRCYDPVSTAATLDKPMLIIQGGRDYQVTVEDDLSRWKAGIGHRPDVTIRVYDADNHLFFPGAGPSTPAEYEPAQHVDPAVVADIAGWLMPRQGIFARFFSRFKRQKLI